MNRLLCTQRLTRIPFHPRVFSSMIPFHKVSYIHHPTVSTPRMFSTTPPTNHQDDEKLPPKVPSKPSVDWARLGTMGGAIALLASKSKYALVVLKLTKFSSLASMMLTSAAYAYFYGWPFALGMVSLVLIHESGHALAMRHYHIPFSPMVFIPFVGAAVSMKEQPTDAYVEAMVALAGPLLGSAAAAAVMGVGVGLDSSFLLALSQFGLMVNLFNMMPIGSMDGGRIAGAVSPLFLIGGLGAGFWLAFNGFSNPIFYLILLSATYTTGQRLFSSTSPHPSYYKISGSAKALISASYLALLALLIAALAVNTKYLQRSKTRPESIPIMDEEMEGDEEFHWRRFIQDDSSSLEKREGFE